VAVGRSWKGTRYHDNAHVKGAGIDCLWLLIEVFREAGVVDVPDPGKYAPDFMLHRGEEHYLENVQRFAAEYDWRAMPPLPGDVVMWRYGRCFSHSAIVSDWPKVIHAYAPYGFVAETDTSLGTALMLMPDGSPRPMRAFSCWPR
jgi:cell wall-associated NlpC family hydrolase